MSFLKNHLSFITFNAKEAKQIADPKRPENIKRREEAEIQETETILQHVKIQASGGNYTMVWGIIDSLNVVGKLQELGFKLSVVDDMDEDGESGSVYEISWEDKLLSQL